MQTAVAGHVTVDGAGRAGVDVLLVDPGGAPLAAARTGAGGAFELHPARFHDGWVLARLHGEPVVGPIAVRVPAPSRDVVIAVSAAAAVTLALDFAPPAGVPLDWATVSVSPRGQPGVPDAIVHAAGWVGTGPARLASYEQVRVTAPHATLRLLPGLWSVTVDHVVEGPRSPLRRPPANWTSDVLTLPDGTKVPEQARAHRISILGDLHVTLTARPVID